MAFSLSGLFGKLFGGKGGASAAAEAAPTEYNGYSIRPTPRREGAGWLTAGTISKQFPDGPREHRFVRADIYVGFDDSVAFCISKAKQIIDEQGDRIFRSA